MKVDTTESAPAERSNLSLRLPAHIAERLRQVAAREANPVATVARRILVSGLDSLPAINSAK